MFIVDYIINVDLNIFCDVCVGEFLSPVCLCQIFRCQIYYCTVVMHASHIMYIILICTDLNVEINV